MKKWYKSIICLICVLSVSLSFAGCEFFDSADDECDADGCVSDEVVDYTDTIEQLLNSIEELQQSIEEMQSTNDENAQEIAGLQDTIDDLEDTIDDLQAQVDEYENTSTGGDDSASSSTSTADVIESVCTSIVSISAKYTLSNNGGYSSWAGSGVVIAEGYLVTNYHVVGDLITTSNISDKYITLLFWTEELINTGYEEYGVTQSILNSDLDAAIVYTDSVQDLAIVKFDTTTYNPAPIEVSDMSSDDLRVGDDVYALGYGLGAYYAVSGGMVSSFISSAYMTVDGTPKTMENLIVHSAEMNGGNSGGALIDSEGKLVGINTLVASVGFSTTNGDSVYVNAEGLNIAVSVLNFDEEFWAAIV